MHRRRVSDIEVYVFGSDARIAIAIFACVFIGVPVSALISSIAKGNDFKTILMLAVALLSGFGVVLFLYAESRSQRIRISEEGLSTSTRFSKPIHIEWSEVAAVRSLRYRASFSKRMVRRVVIAATCGRKVVVSEAMPRADEILELVHRFLPDRVPASWDAVT